MARQKPRYLGKYSETPCREIDLPWSPESLKQALLWGANPEDAPYTHQEIAHWCDRLFMAHIDSDDPPEMEIVVRVACDVDAQWDMYLANTFTLEQLQKLDFAEVRLPVAWFHQWLSELEAA